MLKNTTTTILSVLITFLAILAGIGVGAWVVDAPASDPAPVIQVTEPTADEAGWVQVRGVECPSEDSCDIDYRNGDWYIREVTP